jgi:hypothetical protein
MSDPILNPPAPMPVFLVTLVYSDGTSWFAGGFNSQEAADAWIATERTRPYWKQDTEVQVVQQ